MSRRKQKVSRRPTSSTPSSYLSESNARDNLKKGINKLASLKALITHCITKKKFDEAEKLLLSADSLVDRDDELEALRAQVYLNTGRYVKALEHCKQAIDINPKQAHAYFMASHCHYKSSNFEEALSEVERALDHSPKRAEYLFHKATILTDLYRYNEASPIFEDLIKKHPNNYIFLNNAGNLSRDLGELKKAQDLFLKAIPLAGKDSYPYSNYLTTLHYDPTIDRDYIFRIALEWEKKFSSNVKNARPQPNNRQPNRPLVIGMMSDGFRNHPVGRMIITSLEQLPAHAYQLHFYSSSAQNDKITNRFKNIGNFKIVSHMSDEQLSSNIINDKIDILVDLSGHNNGTRMRVMAMEPAPVTLKWVGGLINTTGLSSIDYLITDWNETPAGDESLYTENLIRMPGDYICYEMPDYTPEVSPLPALKNKYLTLGCFNNPTKINHVILEQWSRIMHSIPNSHLYLKGHQYNSPDLCNRFLAELEQHGISSDRVRIEGPSGHNKLLECYNEVDIALDPWPYSGGLTTCEAFIMGVPVVTMPGPTFAGRHSATHLVNAGMPELVTHSWDEYRERVIELASDLDSLATIRSHLRTILLQSPVCDAETFAGHLNNALRAIWQRYTDGKEPAALSFTAQGEVLFEGDSAPMQLRHPEAPVGTEDETFKWEFEGKVIAIDHGAQLFDVPIIKQMLEQGTIELIAFDPASKRLKNPLRQVNSVHYYPNVLLGSGSPATLYACQEDKLTSTLKPLDHEYLPHTIRQGLSVLAELPINTLALDKVSELPSVDWLILDDLNNSIDVLDYGCEALKDTLLIQADIAFQPTHERQPNFAEVSHWAARHGFRFYCFHGEEKTTPVPQNIIGANRYANELTRSTALFIPSQQRMSALSNNHRNKLAFIADTAYGLEGLCYEVLGHNSEETAEGYIQYKVKKRVAENQPHVPSTGVRRKPRIIIDNSNTLPSDNAGEQITKPQLTLPIEAATHLREIYANANSILEYGSGGSTIVASEMSGKRIFTVENDIDWANKMRLYIAQEPHPSPAVIHTVDVGTTGPWARPINDANWRSFHQYPLSVWDRDDFVHPDVILIDGRFRVACFVTAAMRITKPTIVLFDDYGDRDYYHEVERLAKPVKMIGRMAHFELKPGDIPADELTWMIASFNQVTYANNTRR